MQKNKTWNELKSEVNLVHFAISEYGYTIDPKKSTAKWYFLKNEGNKIIIRNDNNRWLYKCENDKTAGGSILDLVMQHEPTFKDFKQAYNKIIEFTGKPQQDFKLEYSKSKFNREQFLKKYSGVASEGLINNTFLLSRGIEVATLNNPRFLKTISTIENEYRNENNKIVKFQNTAFPIHDKDGLIGFDSRNNAFKGTVGIKEGGLWMSKFDKTKDIDVMFLVDSPIDALAHFQMYGKEKGNILYVATVGSITDKQIKHIETYLKEGVPSKYVVDGVKHEGLSKVKSIELGFDGKPADQRFSTQLMGGISAEYFSNQEDKVLENAKIRPVFVKNSANYVEITLNAKNSVDGIKYMSELHNKVDELNLKQKRFTGDDKTFNVQDNTLGDNSVVMQIHFKNHLPNWMAINEFIIDYKFDKAEKIKLEFPKGKDWNDELKESNEMKKEQNKQNNQEKYLDKKQETKIDKKGLNL